MVAGDARCVAWLFDAVVCVGFGATNYEGARHLGKQEQPALPPALAQIGTSELALIELQGSLEVEGDKCGQTVGKLTIDADGKGKPTLLIGYHLLEGKIVSLNKPFAVLHRAAPSSASEDAMDVDDSAPEPPSYEICAVVRKKLVFSKRPMPMVGLAGGAASAKPASSAGKM